MSQMTTTQAQAADSGARAGEPQAAPLRGVTVTFQYGADFDPARLISIAENARQAFAGMPGLRSKVFTIDHAQRRAVNFYVWESEDAARGFFSAEMRRRVTGLYGAEPTIAYLEIAQLVDNAGGAPAG